MTFQRLHPWQNQTWAYFLFKRHHTELNAMYWAYTPTLIEAKKQISVSPRQSPAITFGLGPATQLVWQDVVAWRNSIDMFENWVRLSALMSISGYFEIYLRKVVSLALESDPGVQYGKSQAVDGFTFKKHESRYSFFKQARNCVEGDWNQRLSAYQRFFSKTPPLLLSSVRELENIRIMRNGVGHAFGRGTTEYQSHTHVRPKEMASLDEAKLKDWLGIIDNLAQEIDKHLGLDHIGEYESLCFYHEWQPEPTDVGMKRERALNKSFSRWLGAGPGIDFCRELIRYYNGL
jgi:hypothetical protein